MAKVVFSSKTAAARSAAIVGPLQKIFGNRGAEDEEHLEEEEQQQQEQQSEAVLESSGVETTSSVAASATNSVFSALVARAEASATVSAPVDTPFARRELREFQQDYYRRAIVGNQNEATEAADEEPDLSIPVGDEYLYLAQ
jgi:hypothetical protein